MIDFYAASNDAIEDVREYGVVGGPMPHDGSHYLKVNGCYDFDEVLAWMQDYNKESLAT